MSSFWVGLAVGIAVTIIALSDKVPSSRDPRKITIRIENGEIEMDFEGFSRKKVEELMRRFNDG